MNRWFQLVLLILTVGVSGCSYNVREINTAGLTGSAAELSNSKKIREIPDDPVFGFGLLEDQFIARGQYQVVFAEMPGDLINEMLGYTYAWHHGVAYDVVTHTSYPVQVVYAGKSGGFSPRIPCKRHVQVFIEGLDTLDSNVHVVIGNTRGDKFFDLLGNQVVFQPQDYVAGKWEAVGKVGTSLKDVLAVYDGEDLQAIKDRTAYWMHTGKYKIPDVGSDRVWHLITPYQTKQGGVDIVKSVARINPNYSKADKIRSAAMGFVISTDPMSTALSILISSVHIPFIEEHKANGYDFNVMAKRLDEESSGCSIPKIYVPVSKEMVTHMNGGQ